MLTYLRHFVTHNWYLKLFALLLSFLLWFTIASETISVINRTVPLEFQDIPPNMEIIRETTTQVNLQLRGSSSLLNEMPPAAVTAAVSLAGEDPGDKTFSLLSLADIQAPFGVEVVRIDPPQVQFTLEQTMRRTLPVDHNVEGEPAEGYIVEDIFVTPPTVDVSGPETSVLPLESLTTTAIRIDGETSSVREFVDLNLVDPLIRLETLQRPEVFVSITEQVVESTFTIPADPSSSTEGWSPSTASIEATISGPITLMNEFDPSALSFTFEIEGLEPGSYELSPQILGLTDRFSVVGLAPETVQVTLVAR